MLELKDISFGYNKSDIFSNINLNITKGSIFGLFGPSGTGKTTLLNIIGGILKPNKGKVLFNGENIFEYKFNKLCKYRNQIVGYAFQDFNLFYDFSVEANIDIPFTIGNLKRDKQWEEYIINYFEIKKLLDKQVKSISGGEKERVSLAKALIHKPRILLLDEPGSSLNDELKTKVYSIIKEYSKNNICIASSHDKDFKEICGERLVF